ncbi:DMT family transporter [Thalassolituus pacificus]|uniref:DMT family transporter n=1 Tax=Thalassolituus pacificus TaxID=2975440 RepID=A0A9X2WEZ2_9GAMM|nr:DMT family transporter [Thalassolituus pacificus]MCT7358482.1 DMT family transporter [Thalassolituus pacificus]
MFVLTLCVLLAFAANSLLCRWALVVYDLDPLIFSLLRLGSGALTLTLLLLLNRRPQLQRRDLVTGSALLLYALAFAYAYLALDTGVGAFILFATVQLSLLLVAHRRGQRLQGMALAGVVISFIGLVMLLLPGNELPDLIPSALMLLSGLGWAAFVVLGQGSAQPLRDVQGAFVSATLLLLPLFGWWWVQDASVDVDGFVSALTWQGILLALASGVLASGLGYWGWYRLLPALGLQRAAQLQLLVPVLATLLGSLILAEIPDMLSLLAMALIITGVLIALRFRRG